MTDHEFIDIVRRAQARGGLELRGELDEPYWYAEGRGVRKVAIRNINGARNCDPTDLWVESLSGFHVVGRCNLNGDLEGWPARLISLR